MASQEHVDLLKQGQGAEQWKTWLQQNQKIVPNLSDANLNGANLSGADLEHANLSGADLCNCIAFVGA